MACLLHVQLAVLALGVAAQGPLAFSQTAAAPATSPILAPNAGEKAPPPAAAKRSRAMSPEVAAALAAASPKYSPPPPKPEPKPESELVDMRDVDKPANQIIRLPKVIVQEKSPVFTERAISTKKGLTDIAMRRYISDVDRAMNRFTIPLFGTSAESRALAMYAEDERLKNMSELEATATAVSAADAAGGAYIRRESEKTFMRSSDFGWSNSHK